MHDKKVIELIILNMVEVAKLILYRVNVQDNRLF